MTAIIDIVDGKSSTAAATPPGNVHGSMGRAMVPSGASTGAHEAVELRDGNKPLHGQGRREGRGRGQRRAMRQHLRHGCRGPDRARQGHDRSWMAPPTRQARRQRHSRRLAGGGPRRCPVERPAALPLCRRCRRPAAAGADDEHHQWRRACRQPDRLPGIHDHAGRRRTLADAVRMGARSSTRSRRNWKAAATTPMSATRAALRPISRRAGCARLHHEIDREGRLPAGRGHVTWRSIAPPPSSSRTASTTMKARVKRSLA
jgi:hypothetical protein